MDESTPKEGKASSKLSEMEVLMCSEHEEKLKLFCETDQKLVCVICRDGDKHKGHVFKTSERSCTDQQGKMDGYLHMSQI